MTGDTWACGLGGQGIDVLLPLMTGVALDMGLLVVELMVGLNWGGGFRCFNPTDKSHQAWGDLLG